MDLRLRLTRKKITLLLAFAALVSAGVAYATVPDGNGVFTACKLNGTGTIRLIDPSLSGVLGRCSPTLETQITWNQQGQKGEQGLQGPKGDPGAQGEPGAPGRDGIDGVSGYQIVSSTGRLISGTPLALNAFCPSQKKVLGGGMSGPGVRASQPFVAAGTYGWAASWFEDNGNNYEVTVYAICANAN